MADESRGVVILVKLVMISSFGPTTEMLKIKI